jgi:hypothetical protein
MTDRPQYTEWLDLKFKLSDNRQALDELRRKIDGLKQRLSSEHLTVEDAEKLASELRDLPTALDSVSREFDEMVSAVPGMVREVQSAFRDFWDVQVKAVNYLLIAHAAGLVTCVTLLKDYKDSGPLKGIGLFVVLFGCGLLAAIVASALLLLQRLSLLGSEVGGRVPGEKIFRDMRLAVPVYVISCVILIAAIAVAMSKFISL